jgi:GNAT superfamily N-acetyltransferase
LSETVNIRPVCQSDHAAWLTLWNGYNAFYGRSGATALDAKITQATWQRIFDDSEPVHAMVAEGPDGLLGLAHYVVHRSTLMLGHTCYLHDLFTAEQARGKGIGRALIGAVYNEAANAGCGRVYWQTHETNEKAMKLYDQVAVKSGFVVYRKDLGGDDRYRQSVPFSRQ